MRRRFGIEEGWLTLLLTWSLVIVAASAIINAELIDGLELLPLISTLAVLSGLLLAKSRFSGRTAHLMGLIYGLFVITLLIGRMLPVDLTWRERVFDLVNRQFVWLGKAVTQGSSRDGLIFVIHTSLVFWMLGFTASWYTFRHPRVWRVVLPTGLVLLSVIYYYYGPKPLVGYLALYALLALIYIARTHLVDREKQWRMASVRYEKSIRFSFLQASFLAALVALGLAWGLPTAQANTVVSNALGDTGINETWRGFQDNWTRLFASLRSYGTSTSDAYRESLSLGGPRSVTNSLVMDVYVEERIPYIYWQAVAYDTYEDGRWSIASDADQILRLPDEGPISPRKYARRQDVKQTFVNFIPNSGTMYGAPDVVETDRQMFVTQSRDDEGSPVVHSVQSRYVMRQGDQYEVVSSYSLADATNLRQASQQYPNWITENYLQVPQEVTAETLALAEELTSPYSNSFDKAIAIRDYLRNNIRYNDQISAPPEGIEPIHYVLFDNQQAYCNYYASSMAVMLRSQGVPARFVAGYAQGEWDEDSNSYRVRASNAHSWVEVFFPQYGWIPFEPTAALPLGERQDSSSNPGDAFGDQSLLDDTERLPEGFQEEDPTSAEGLGDLLDEQEEPPSAAQSDSTQVTLLQVVGAVSVMGLAVIVSVLASRVNSAVESDVGKSYERLARWAPWLGVFIRPAHTPYERANMLSAAVPEGRIPLINLTHQFVRQQFSRARAAEADFDPRGEWSKLRPIMLRSTVLHQFQRLRDRFRISDEGKT